MLRIRFIEIQNFRAIKLLIWAPSPGVNCLIGPGDAGKSSILDAIELCLAGHPSKTASLSDSDFHRLNTDETISISLTLGGLDDSLLDLEEFGLYLRAFDATNAAIRDEPVVGLETVVTLNVTIDSYREATWGLVSARAAHQGKRKTLSRKDRDALLAARLGTANVAQHLTWSKGSVLTRLTEDRLNVEGSLVHAARLAKTSFGSAASAQLAKSLASVEETAEELGVPTSGKLQALLDTKNLSFRESAVALHSGEGVPLRCLGTGSSRLLVAGLQRDAATAASVVLVDEVEYGLEPHRLTRLLNALGSKDEVPAAQVFLTTHSPIALFQLRAQHIFIVRKSPFTHFVTPAGTDPAVQGALRKSPSSFLAPNVIVCEGASEQGLLRGIDDYAVSEGYPSLLTRGVSLLDAGGGSPKACIDKAMLFAKLGYRVAALIDNDVLLAPGVKEKFVAAGGTLFTWEPTMALEDALFAYLSDQNVGALLEQAEENVGLKTMEEKIQEQFGSGWTLGMVVSASGAEYSADYRKRLGLASRTKTVDKNGNPKAHGWFKSIDRMERVGRELVAPQMKVAKEPRAPLFSMLTSVFQWTKNGA